MNIFEKFMLAREVVIKEGEITMDDQRIIIFPVNFMGLYSLKLKDNQKQAKKLYSCMKKGMIEYSKPLGKEYLLTYKDFLDRWIKYCAFGGWGIVDYKLIEKEGNYGLLNIKNLPMHLYLKNKGIGDPSDVIFEGLIAGSLSGTFRTDIDVIEIECVCSGSDICVYYWGPKEHLTKKFPDIASKRFGD